MKGSGALMASVLAASTAALTSSSSASVGRHCDNSNPTNKENKSSLCGEKMERSSSCSTVEEKFAPRFDGLRFIETLVTAHR